MSAAETRGPFEVMLEVTPDDTLIGTIDSSFDGETSWEVFEDEIDHLYEAVTRMRRAMRSIRSGTMAMPPLQRADGLDNNGDEVRTRPDTETEQLDFEPPADASPALRLLGASGLPPEQPRELFLPSPSDDEEGSSAAE